MAIIPSFWPPYILPGAAARPNPLWVLAKTHSKKIEDTTAWYNLLQTMSRLDLSENTLWR